MAMSFGIELFVMTVLLVSSGERCNGAVVETFSLAKGWTVKNENGSKLFTDVTLPNGVYTLYKRQYPSEDILDSYNDVQLRWIGMEDWTWTTEFDTPDSHQSRKFVNLTFFGIDTVATIKLNGELLGETNNMFNRYSFNTKDKLSVAGKNQLEVRIKSPIREAKRLAALYPGIPPECPDRKYNGECHMNMLRKMQSSFSWDWGLAAPSLGIWKTVLLEVHDVAIIRDVDVATTLRDDKWVINVKVYLETGLQEPFYGDLTMYAVDIFDDPVKIVFDKDPVDYRNPVITFSESVDKNRIKRWWPNGYGDPKLYHIHFTWHGCFASGHDPKLWSISQKSIRIGFRTIELIQRELADGNTFLFKVNNVEMFMKGSNWIPSHILPERNADENRVKYLLKAAKDANLNMLRVWGGGVYESDYFYDLADSYGILIWQDMMFACAMYPVFDDFLKSVETETIQNALRIAYHPSIAIWATNNENEVALAQNWYNTSHTYDLFAANYRELYVATVYHALKVIVHSGRPEVLYSSPSNGLKTEESNFLSKDPQNHHYGDVHYYNYDFDGWNPVIYPKARFISEYGFQSFPSITSWYQVMAKNDNLSDLMDHRQHSPLTSAPIMGQLERHFFVPDKSDSNYLAAVIYLSQVSQAMIVKTETELYRSLRSTEYNTMGALYWQLNDVWIAPSWSSIDFHGRFKILQYWAKEFMAPLAVIAQADTYNNVNVYVAYDTKEEDDRTLIVTMNTIMWSSLLPKNSTIWPFVIRNNTVAKIQTFSYEDYLHGPFNVRNSFLQFVLHDVSGNVYSTTYLFPANFRTVENVNDGDPTAIITNQRCDSSMFDNKLTKMVSLSIKVRYPSLFVFLEFIRTDIKKHSFSKNGFIQVEPIQTVYLEYEDENCLSRDFRLTDITISHANIYLKK